MMLRSARFLWDTRPSDIIKLMVISVLMVLVLLTGALAGEDVKYIMPDIPDEATKRAALLLAYEVNNKSMNGHMRMIDLSGPPPAVVRTIPIEPTPKKKRDK